MNIPGSNTRRFAAIIGRYKINALSLAACSLLLSSRLVVGQTFDLDFTRSFPFPFGSGPPGCSVILNKEFCPTVPLIKIPDVSVEVLAGNAQLLSVGLGQPNCVVIKMRLWVDHKGYEGRECLAPLARAVAHIEFPTSLGLEEVRK